MPVIILPVVLIITGIALLLVFRIKPDFGYFWISAAAISLATWIAVLVMRWQLPFYFSMNLWQEIGYQIEFPFFQLDRFSWPYAFSVVSLVLAVVITAPVRISQKSNPASWAGSLAIGGLTLLGVLAANPLTLIMAWTGIDILELVYLLKNAKDNFISRQVVISFTIGICGTFLAVWAMLVSQSQGLPLSFSSMTPDASQFLVMAAGVRLAIFPIMVFFRQDFPIRRELGVILKFASPAMTLVLLSRLPAVPVSAQVSPYLFSLAIIAVVYGAVLWFTSADEIIGRPYWIVSFSALAMVCLLQGRPEISTTWGSAMILGGGLLSLFTSRQIRLLFIPLLGFVCLTGIIFTPLSIGWSGIWISPFLPSNLIFMIGHSLLVGGFLKHTFRQEGTQVEIDRWVQIIYPAGLLVLVVSNIIIGFWSIRDFGVQSFWIGPTVSTGLALFWLVIRSWLERGKPIQSLFKTIGSRIGTVTAAIIGLRWLYIIIAIIYKIIRQFVLWLTSLLEGDGGVLWALLVLLLIITLIQPGVMP